MVHKTDYGAPYIPTLKEIEEAKAKIQESWSREMETIRANRGKQFVEPRLITITRVRHSICLEDI